MKTVGLLLVLAGFVVVWGIGIQGLSLSQLKADVAAWAGGKPSVAQKGVYA